MLQTLGALSLAAVSVWKSTTQDKVSGGRLDIVDSSTSLREGSGNSLRIQTNSGYVDIGPMNTSWSHFQTDRSQFYFDKQIGVNGNVYSLHRQRKNAGDRTRCAGRTYTAIMRHLAAI